MIERIIYVLIIFFIIVFVLFVWIVLGDVIVFGSLNRVFL